MTDASTGRERAGGRVVLLVVLGLLLLVGGGWAAAYALAGDDVPRGTTISGVAVGGRSPEEAVRTLRRGLADRAAAPIEVTVGGTTQEVDPADAGFSVDHEQSVAEAGGRRTWHPVRLWDHYTGGQDLEAVVEVDEPTMEAFLDRLQRRFGRPARDGDLDFRGASVRVDQARVGRQLDREQARAALEAAYLRPDPSAEVALRQVAPAVDADDVQEALDGFANPALSAPVTLVFDDRPVRLTPAQYAAALDVRAEGGELEPRLDGKVLTRLLDEVFSGRGAPVDATVALVGGRPRVIPAKPGVTYDREQVARGFLRLVTAPEGKRRMKVEAKVAEPDFTTAEARELGITEKVSTFTTYYPPASYRDTNIGRAAELVDGTLLEPGETFSLNETVGERTAANGFTEGFIISDGVFKEELGGGVSQMATTLFNAMFFAGLEDVEHKPHSFYIDRYPVGREATVVWGAVDLRFRNDSPYGVLIDAEVTPSAGRSQGVVTVSMWSTKHWDIATTTSPRYNLTEPGRRVLRTRDCYPNEGYGGFDVDVKRYFRRPGRSEIVRTENFHTTYTPSDKVVCKPPRD